jgi:mannose-6-phosphate isomerase-like protein (cupin superfamily)
MTGFAINDALNCLVAAKADYTRLIEQKTFDVGIYRPLRVDPQTPHSRDELYMVASGRGEFICAGETKAFGHGDLFFVPVGVEHRFLDFSEDFATWVIFFGHRQSPMIEQP